MHKCEVNGKEARRGEDKSEMLGRRRCRRSGAESPVQALVSLRSPDPLCPHFPNPLHSRAEKLRLKESGSRASRPRINQNTLISTSQLPCADCHRLRCCIEADRGRREMHDFGDRRPPQDNAQRHSSPGTGDMPHLAASARRV